MTAFDPPQSIRLGHTRPGEGAAPQFTNGQAILATDYPIRALLDAARGCEDSPRRQKKEKTAAQERLSRELVRHIPEHGELPVTREQLSLILKRITGRIVALGEGDELQHQADQALLVRHVIAEAQIGRDLRFTARELTMMLHKVTLTDMTALSQGYPKYILERAISAPNPVAAAAELEARRATHEKYIRAKLNGETEQVGDIAPLIARKSFRLKPDPEDPLAQADHLLNRYLSDRSWFEQRLTPSLQTFARHLASRSFYLSEEKRENLLGELAAFERGLSEDPRVKQFHLRAPLTLSLLGVVRNPIARARATIDTFEREYLACKGLLPGEPEAIYRGLALRAALTLNSDSPDSHPNEGSKVPKNLPALIARYQGFQERFSASPTLGRYLALEMTLSGDPESRLRDELGRVRRSLEIESERVPRERLLAALEAVFCESPEERHTMYRKCLRGNPGRVPSALQGEFAHFAKQVRATLSSANEP